MATERQRALAAFNRRIRAAERKGFIFENKERLQRLPTAKLRQAEDYGLYKYASSFQLKGVDNQPGEIVSYETWRRYEKARLAEARLYRRNVPSVKPPEVKPEDWKPPKNNEPRLTATTAEGLEKVIAGAEKRSNQKYWDERNETFVENYLKTLDTAFDQNAADAIREQIKSKGRAWAVRKLIQAQEGYLDIAPNSLFDSTQGTGTDNMTRLLRFWDVTYNREVEQEWVDEFE